ncbi:restriction endonuclease fold toxin-2 domain-containing protein [Streptomyces sp. DSM 42041]|uniref:Restriction endonuclease fold toxin-2 domain-containing protein n=1 Tax=Streptomyces hazeniae TaxID=3075538 RepID=A0ABU2NVF0_9ACTN|nr:restriction endonuclease fold toxin-2 domain-containing protein [Streptomyces sp. DSM 42041]MDT0380213.1 restriction endonuclease fold toxin-2 domain-containing protein [Streptomyces sp. DSM 42041]
MDLINASWGMHSLNEWYTEAVHALARELDEQAGMAGDDEAGRAFATMYDSAARTTVNQMGEATYIVGRGSEGLLENANNYMATESKIASDMLEAIGQSGAAPSPGTAGQRCSPAPLGRGNYLPDLIGETSFVTQYLVGDRFRGSPEKLRDVAATWRKARGIALQIFYDAQDCWRRATRNGEGETADAIDNFFTKFVGRAGPPSQVSDQDTLLANLPTACQQIATACEHYADHIVTASERSWGDTLSDAFLKAGGESLWDTPVFGGNGEDGGLHEAISGDGKILNLASLGHHLDSSQKRVPVPQPKDKWWVPDGPLIPPLVPLPVPRIPRLVPAGYTPPDPSLYRPAMPPPSPPDPRFPPLTPMQRNSFDRWADSLRDGGFSGGTKAERDYQRRTAGYPEKEVPIDPRKSARGTLMVDGLRHTDGMAVEAKFVKKPGCTFRNLDDLQSPSNFQEKVLHKKDEQELFKYKSAIEYPGNADRLRGVEVATNDPDAVPYWNALLVAHEVPGYGRYAP